MALLAVGFAIVLREGPTSEGVHAESANKMFGMPLFVEGVDDAARDGLAASCAQASSLLVVVNLAVRFPSMLVERAASEGLLAVLAHEVLRVPLLSQCVDAFTADGLVARATLGGKGGVEAALAIRTRILFEERATLEGSQALRADEVVDVPLLVQGRHAAVQDGLVAMRASSAEQLLVALLAMWEPVLFVEIIGAEWVLTVTAHEMLRMVRVAQCLDDFAKDGIVACRARTPRRRSSSVDVLHLGGKVFQQVVQIISSHWLCGSCCSSHSTATTAA